MRIHYTICDRCGKKFENGYYGNWPKDKNYPLYTMEVRFGLGKIRYNGKMIPDTQLDLCDECLGFFLNELKTLEK